MKKIAFHNFRGGAGSTTYASNATIYAAERGLQAIGATLGFRHDFGHHLAHADVPWCDGIVGLPHVGDLLVLDVHSHCKLIDVVRPDLWVMPITDRIAVDHAVRILPQLAGPILWVPTKGFRDPQVPEEWAERVAVSPPIPRSEVFSHSYVSQRPVWVTHPRSAVAAAMKRLFRDMLARVGLHASVRPIQQLVYKGEPTYDRHSYRGYEAREEAARPMLQGYFDRVRPAA
ncbi:MAG: hypothetical protein JNL82_36470 [Myxococcales bacterium]|nr:hypothetical protein [Myxococcales bacterium]